ncbi:MAG: DNA repair protein RecO [Sandaracinaceae bacterium]|nr:DNA repair protein RecO [Sandaracinaceae bacterium]MDW8247108.1 DNA repair protein RecO [Sandaracinaceae bacterium]
MPNLEAEEAFILRSSPTGESHRLIRFLTRKHGIVNLWAGGALKSRKRFAGLEPFTLLEIEWRLRPELSVLTGARIKRHYPRIWGSLALLERAGWLLRLVDRMWPEGSGDPKSFEELKDAFERLERSAEESKGAEEGESVLASAFRLLEQSGWLPRYDACVSCGRVPRPQQPVRIDPEKGGIVCRVCGSGPLPLSPLGRRALHAFITQGTPPPLSAQDIEELKAIAEAFVQTHAR